MGATIKATPGNVGGKINRRNKEAKRVTRRALMRAAHRGRGVMTKQTPVDQGQLKNSWKVRKSMGSGIGGDSLAATLTNDAPHAGIVEGGARPHKVGLAGWMAIYDWARRNIQFTTTLKSGKNKGKQSKPRSMSHDEYSNPMLSEITWGIVNRIAKFGQEPTYFVRNSMWQLHNIAIQEVAKALEKLANKPARGGGKK